MKMIIHVFVYYVLLMLQHTCMSHYVQNLLTFIYLISDYCKNQADRKKIFELFFCEIT